MPLQLSWLFLCSALHGSSGAVDLKIYFILFCFPYFPPMTLFPQFVAQRLCVVPNLLASCSWTPWSFWLCRLPLFRRTSFSLEAPTRHAATFGGGITWLWNWGAPKVAKKQAGLSDGVKVWGDRCCCTCASHRRVGIPVPHTTAAPCDIFYSTRGVSWATACGH